MANSATEPESALGYSDDARFLKTDTDVTESSFWPNTQENIQASWVPRLLYHRQGL